jgi:hypothetical protein
MAQVTLDQRRLEQLRRQLYGKEQSQKKGAGSHSKSTDKNTLRFEAKTEHRTSTPVSQHEVSYLRTDLLKILILAALAIAVQAGLYLATQMKLIHLGF